MKVSVDAIVQVRVYVPEGTDAMQLMDYMRRTGQGYTEVAGTGHWWEGGLFKQWEVQEDVRVLLCDILDSDFCEQDLANHCMQYLQDNPKEQVCLAVFDAGTGANRIYVERN